MSEPPLLKKELSSFLLWACALLLSLTVAPHFWHLSPWISLSFIGCIGLRFLFWREPQSLPPKALRYGLLFIILILVIITAQWTESRQFGVALLVAGTGLKFLEVRDRRDVYISSFLGYFVLITLFLFYQSPGMTLYVLGLTIAFTALLIALNQVQVHQRVWRSASLMVIAALPVMMILFIFFPRLQGPLWQLNFSDEQAVSGITDQISMGSISQLSLSDEVAFRVKFKNKIPPPEQRYWRGLVLWTTDGRQWQRQDTAWYIGAFSSKNQDSIYEYEVTMEASGQPWLFPLDHVLRTNAENTDINTDGEVLRGENIDRRLSYTAFSIPAHTRYFSDREWQLGLSLPDNLSPRLLALTRSWQEQAENERDLIDLALNYFRQNEFIYTLAPPILDQPDPVSQFLFETRQGFCEHYATSFVILMRLLNIPARVVVGYQGGEWNPIGQHLTVRQSDAHAWAEVWLEDQGWVRIDPTTAVAPERIERTIDLNATRAGQVVFQLDGGDWAYRLAQRWKWLKDNLEMSWHYWVLGYNRDRQRDLWQKMGLGDFNAMQLSGAAIIITLLLSLLLFWWLQRQKWSGDPIQQAYQLWLHKLKKAGIEVPIYSAPLQLKHHLIRRLPQQAGEIERIMQAYIELRYAPQSSVQLKEWRTWIKTFRPKIGVSNQ